MSVVYSYPTCTSFVLQDLNLLASFEQNLDTNVDYIDQNDVMASTNDVAKNTTVENKNVVKSSCNSSKNTDSLTDNSCNTRENADSLTDNSNNTIENADSLIDNNFSSYGGHFLDAGMSHGVDDEFGKEFRESEIRTPKYSGYLNTKLVWYSTSLR